MDVAIGTALAAAVLAAAVPPPGSEIEASGPGGTLRGTLVDAGRDSPVVLIVPGSGPTDRDGNSPLGIRASSYRLLAEALAERGVSTVRIDKRGMFASAVPGRSANAVTLADYVADVGAWVEAARGRTGADCVWLLGHSEGGLVVLAAAQEVAGICGLILAAAPGRPMGDVLREQLRANPANAPILDQALSAIDRIEAGEPVAAADLHPALLPLFRPEVQGFLASVFAADPAALAAAYSGPILILQGARDLQVAEADARALAAARPDARLVILPGVNHVLKRVESDDRAANLAAYADPDLPIAPAIVDAIVQTVLP